MTHGVCVMTHGGVLLFPPPPPLLLPAAPFFFFFCLPPPGLPLLIFSYFLPPRYPIDRLQLELELQGRGERHEYVSEKARLVFTVLGSVYPQFPAD